MRNRRMLIFLGLFAFTFSLSHVAAAQLAARPAEDWTKTLESHDRVANLKMDEIVAKLGLKPGDTVADIGAGSGLFEVPLAKAVSPGGKVYAVDIDAGFFPQIKRKADEAHATNVQTVLGKYTDPNLPAKNIEAAQGHARTRGQQGTTRRVGQGCGSEAIRRRQNVFRSLFSRLFKVTIRSG